MDQYNDPLATVSHEHSVVLPCPVADNEQLCNIPLPRRSPLGRYEGFEYLPSHDWQGYFLCLRHARVYVCSPRKIHLEMQVRDPGQPVSPLWKIDAICGHDRCGVVRTIYTAKMPDWTLIEERIHMTHPKLACEGHDFAWDTGTMRATEFAH